MKRSVLIPIIAFFIILLIGACTILKHKNHALSIEPGALKDTVSNHENTLVYFWTDWCYGSNQQLTEIYLPLHDSIKKDQKDLKMVFIASDENIPMKKVDMLRAKGVSVFYLPAPGSNPLINRIAIRRFVNKAFPGNSFPHIKYSSYQIPVAIFLDRNGEIINKNGEHPRSYILEILNKNKSKN